MSERGYFRRNGGFRVSVNKDELDIPFIHSFLRESYWAKDIPIRLVEESIENSKCFGLFIESMQIGFARVVTDYVTFGYLADVFVIEKYRGRGLASWLIQCCMEHDDLKSLRRWMLVTRDMQQLYKKFGFSLILVLP